MPERVFSKVQNFSKTSSASCKLDIKDQGKGPATQVLSCPHKHCCSTKRYTGSSKQKKKKKTQQTHTPNFSTFKN